MFVFVKLFEKSNEKKKNLNSVFWRGRGKLQGTKPRLVSISMSIDWENGEGFQIIYLKEYSKIEAFLDLFWASIILIFTLKKGLWLVCKFLLSNLLQKQVNDFHER